MRFVNVREFKLKTTQYLKANEELVITRYGKPIARLVPETEETLGDVVRAMGRIFREAGVTKKEALEALESARREVYGPRRRLEPSKKRKKVA